MPAADQVRILALTCPNAIDVCLKRIRLRNRAGEENISREYLEQLEVLYEPYYQCWRKMLDRTGAFQKLDPSNEVSA